MTIYEGIRKELSDLILTPEYMDYIKENNIDPKIFSELFDSLLSIKTKQGESDTDSEKNASLSLLQSLRNKFLNSEL
jgi:hypothetical protein